MVWDYERGSPLDMLPQPWQTDTCIGDWHYKRSILDKHGYKTAETVAHTLVDNVSKNGNLQLNIPLPGHGEPDTDELKFLADFTAWMDVNSVGIYATRPWKIYGEGPSTKSTAAPVRAQGFNEGRTRFGAQDIRFMQKGDTLYAFALGWPDSGQLTITSLADGSATAPGNIERVELLGVTEPLKFTRDATGLDYHAARTKSRQLRLRFQNQRQRADQFLIKPMLPDDDAEPTGAKKPRAQMAAGRGARFLRHGFDRGLSCLPAILGLAFVDRPDCAGMAGDAVRLFDRHEPDAPAPALMRACAAEWGWL